MKRNPKTWGGGGWTRGLKKSYCGVLGGGGWRVEREKRGRGRSKEVGVRVGKKGGDQTASSSSKKRKGGG